MTHKIPTITPMIAYEDAAAAIPWLIAAFGFTEDPEARWMMPDGTIGHAELCIGDGRIMIAQPSPDYRSRIRHAEECAVARAQEESPYVIDGVHVYVPDVQAHHKKALAAGTRILSSGVEEGPVGRLYRAADLEGHRWMFMEQQ